MRTEQVDDFWYIVKGYKTTARWQYYAFLVDGKISWTFMKARAAQFKSPI